MKNAYDPDTFREWGHRLIDELADHLEQSHRGDPVPAIRWRPPQEELKYWEADRESGLASDPMSLFREVLAYSVNLHHPQYAGHQISPPLPVSALAGLVGDLLNNGMGVYEMGAAATAIERVVAREVAGKLGFGPASDGVLTSGGSLANLTALLAARSVKGDGVWKEGQREPLALLVSEEAHYCVDRAVRIMGWGAAGIIKVPVDEQFRMRTEELSTCLERAKKAGRRVIAVVGSACSTSTGAFDDLEAIAAFCQEHGLWFHVDGAHGAPVAFSRKYAHLVRGIEKADSVAMDFHKMLMTPSVTTALLFRDGDDSYRTFQQQGQYLWNRDEEAEWHNLAKRTFECTKLMLSLKVYSILRIYGWELFDQYVTTVIDNGRLFARLIRQHPSLELAVSPQCNIVCFRYVRPGMDSAETDGYNEGIRQKMLEDGSFYIVKTRLHGQTWLRSTLTNPFTEERHLKRLLEQVVTMGKILQREQAAIKEKQTD